MINIPVIFDWRTLYIDVRKHKKLYEYRRERQVAKAQKSTTDDNLEMC